MQNIIFFDTETTGNTEKDFLCQIAYMSNGESFSEMYKPEKRIPPEASAVHHISNKMLEGKPSFKESTDYKKIKKIFEDTSTIAVAHNAPFDISILKNEDITIANFICTLRVARALDPEGKIEKYNLQYLRYLLEIEITAQAHDALGDVMVLEKLFERLLKKVMDTDNVDESTAIQKMIEISSHPSIFRKINFGKYAGQNLEEIAQKDKGYLEWLYNQKLQSDTLEEDWIYTLKHYLGK
ncbi:MAG: exonuclease domain-containing protein [Candidatus Nomurabacteria bacterium]|nr:exonuclease domain-containing protein [Candidatus Nomurabacteria bacterium]